MYRSWSLSVSVAVTIVPALSALRILINVVLFSTSPTRFVVNPENPKFIIDVTVLATVLFAVNGNPVIVRFPVEPFSFQDIKACICTILPIFV